MKSECILDKNIPLTYIDSGKKPKSKKKEHSSIFTILVNSTALRLYYGGADNLKGCEFQRILRDIKSYNPDYIVTFTRPISFTYHVRVHINSTHFQVRDDANQNFDIFVRIKCFDKKNSVIYQNVHIAARESVSHYVKSRSSNRKGKKLNSRFNLLLVGIDSTSNKNFERQLLKTYQYLISKRKEVYHFKMYAKVGDNTYPNLNALLTGKFTWENLNGNKNYFDNISLIWRKYENARYASIFLEDVPGTTTYNNNRSGFYKPPSKFYLRPFSLEWKRLMKELASVKHCSVYGKNEVEMLLDYSKALIEEMEKSNIPYFNFKFITRYTHFDMQGLGALDDLLYDYFEGLIQNGRLKNTFIFLFGDHGSRFGPLRQTLNGMKRLYLYIYYILIKYRLLGMLEDRMPFLLAIPPDNFFTYYGLNDTIFRTNTQRLVTAFDVHKTLLNLLEITKSKKNNSLDQTSLYSGKRDIIKGISLLQSIPINRTCESAFISAQYCPCNWIEPASTMVCNTTSSDKDINAIYLTRLVRYGADLAIKRIKNILSSYRHICLVDELELDTIVHAILVTNNNVTTNQDLKILAAMNINTCVNNTVKMSDIDKIQPPKVFSLLKGLVLSFKLLHYQSVYETTLEFDRQNASKIFKEVMEVFPLDFYMYRSYCIKVKKIKKFCHCIS
ncbi:unnamed protein product [Gordionus sp. m RMFG-2023]